MTYLGIVEMGWSSYFLHSLNTGGSSFFMFENSAMLRAWWFCFDLRRSISPSSWIVPVEAGVRRDIISRNRGNQWYIERNIWVLWVSIGFYRIFSPISWYQLARSRGFVLDLSWSIHFRSFQQPGQVPWWLAARLVAPPLRLNDGTFTAGLVGGWWIF